MAASMRTDGMHCSMVRDRQLQSPRILMLASADHEHHVEPTPYMQLTMAETIARCCGWAISAMRRFDIPMKEPPKPRMKRPAMYTEARPRVSTLTLWDG